MPWTNDGAGGTIVGETLQNTGTAVESQARDRALLRQAYEMIPDFDENGYLPSGIHAASIDDVARRFGIGSDVREAEAESLRWLLPLCRAAGIWRLIIDGSFVTDVVEPNDVDCVLLQGPAYNETSPAAAELEQGLPFLSLQIVRQAAFDYLAGAFFATDRAGISKGVVEIAL